MKRYYIVFILFLAACASRTKHLDKLIGTNIADLLLTWEEPKVVLALQNGKSAYTYSQVSTHSNAFVRPVGVKSLRYSSDVFFVYKVLTTDSVGTILSWQAKRQDSQLDSVGLVKTFHLIPK